MERRFDALGTGTTSFSGTTVSKEVREGGIGSTEVTLVSESFRRGRGIGGFSFSGAEVIGVAGSRRREADRSGRLEWRDVDADDNVLLGTGGNGGKFRFIGVFSSAFVLSSRVVMEGFV